MPSIVWGRHPQEAYENPYEYEAQDQFMREAKALLEDFNLRLDAHNMSFHRDELTLEKATWMLSLDLVDGLLESICLIEERRHRTAARLFRDAVETIDLLFVLHSGGPRASNGLRQWYENRSIPHRDSRDHLRETEGEAAATARKVFYDELSKFTHRTYRALMHSYALGRDDMLVHDSHSMRLLVLPQTIASYLAIAADLVIQASECLRRTGSLSNEELTASWATALEANTIPRRFMQQ